MIFTAVAAISGAQTLQYAGPRSPLNIPDRVNEAISACVAHGATELILEAGSVREEAEVPVVAAGTGLFLTSTGPMPRPDCATPATRTPGTAAKKAETDNTALCKAIHESAAGSGHAVA
ncbi:hypothetical protein K7711_27880 [Nocardia sp. CA2R105]|uniref:hypothetical protein n=1 Tax=Nocardia coffeae TaxID=2873381 RepID=UPI001CA7955F|nr:hypothetical protein [Nocardia coffeae]MBY8860322.1 hypothetical protein [Nocardia coffeae]